MLKRERELQVEVEEEEVYWKAKKRAHCANLIKGQQQVEDRGEGVERKERGGKEEEEEEGKRRREGLSLRRRVVARSLPKIPPSLSLVDLGEKRERKKQRERETKKDLLPSSPKTCVCRSAARNPPAFAFREERERENCVPVSVAGQG